MKALAKTVREILHSGDQFLIPFFQRHYAWKWQNWQRLWDDLLALMDQPPTRVHFLGPLVCTPIVPNLMPGEVPEYQLIDGQQRLTTIIVLLSVLRDLAKEHQLPEIAEEITERYLIQKHEKGIKRYKVLPRVGDREVLISVIEGKADEQPRRVGIIRAYSFLKEVAKQWIKGDPPTRLKQMTATVTGRLSLVVITVEGENPYEIFESLNSTGLPLEESDLIRNFTFMKVSLEDQEEFNRQHWKPFEEMFVCEDESDPSKLTRFYRDYLMRNGEYSQKKQTFVDFKERLKRRPELSPEALAEELKKYARFELVVWRERNVEKPELDAALDRIASLDVATANPLLIHLL